MAAGAGPSSGARWSANGPAIAWFSSSARPAALFCASSWPGLLTVNTNRSQKGGAPMARRLSSS